MIEVKPTTTSRNALIIGGIVLALIDVARITLTAGGFTPWTLLGAAAIVVVTSAAAVVFYKRERVVVDNGELRYRPAIGFERSIPVHSIERVLYAPEIIPFRGEITSRFLVLGVDRRVFLRLQPDRWESTGFAVLTHAFREKGEQVPANTVRAIRRSAPEVLTFSERHPWQFAGLLVLLMFGVVAFFYVVIVVL
jgi:hypothetical protein